MYQRRRRGAPHILRMALESVAATRHRYGAPREHRSPAGGPDLADSTFLAQLEQRTQQVKITLANLEAERARIEQLIAQLQPIIPHYDTLLAAERALVEANVTLEGDAPSPPADLQRQHPEQASSYSWHG
jgi:hypothetical protein